MEEGKAAKSLLEYLDMVPDPRRCQGRRYLLRGILAMLILAALQGESSLRGMWMWARAHQEQLLEPLGFWAAGRIPGLGTVWGVISRLDGEALAQAMGEWAAGWGMTGRLCVDGKTLRGSKRQAEAALRVVTAAAQEVGAILEQTGSAGDELEAAIALLDRLPLAGQVVSLDAGLLQRRVVEKVVEKKGAISAS